MYSWSILYIETKKQALKNSPSTKSRIKKIRTCSIQLITLANAAAQVTLAGSTATSSDNDTIVAINVTLNVDKGDAKIANTGEIVDTLVEIAKGDSDNVEIVESVVTIEI